jgi:hypothetical protein
MYHRYKGTAKVIEQEAMTSDQWNASMTIRLIELNTGEKQ